MRVRLPLRAFPLLDTHTPFCHTHSMTSKLAPLLLLLTASLPLHQALAQINTDWLYHAAPNADPALELVPGESHPFLVRGPSPTIPDAQPITLYLLTRQNFAGDAEEQIYLRWWDGYMAHWIMGSWVKNIRLGDDPNVDPSIAPRFHGLPSQDQPPVTLDLWRVDIPAWVTQPGQNYYAIQAKAWHNGHTDMRYLLSRAGGDFSGSNALGQVWSASDDFEGQDWKMNVAGD